MVLDNELRGSGLKTDATLNADNGITHIGIAADGVGGTYLFNLLNGFNLVSEFLAIDTDNLTFLKLNLQQ